MDLIEIPPPCCEGPWVVPADTKVVTVGESRFFRTADHRKIQKVHADACETSAQLRKMGA